MPRPLRALAALLLVSSPALAQDSLPVTATTRAATVEWLQNLPIDFLAGYFTLEPGIGPVQGGYSLRGGQPYSFATYLDGTPVSAGYRGGAQALLAASGSQLQLPVSGVTDATVTTGVLDLALGDGESGVVSLGTTKGAGRVAGTFDYGTDGLWGAGSSLGLNRLEATLGGGVGSRFAFSLAGTLIGQTSAAYGPTQRDVPIYQAAGIDTTVAIPSVIGDPLADTLYVDVAQFTPNSGLQVPASTTSDYQVLGRMDFAIGNGTSASFTAAASQDQSRTFDYLNLYNPAQLGAQRSASHAYTLGVTHAFGKPGELARNLELAFSVQGDQVEAGPLSAQGEADSRDPAGGFLVAPLDFQFGLEDFPIDDQLVQNVLLNTPNSRRSPYDLENTSQYALVDQYRNNAYGVLGFSEGGGPVGRLALMEEDRLVGRVALDWALNARQSLRVGGEFVRYDLSNYSYNLTSQFYSDVYIEQPSRQAAFAEDEITFGDAVIVIGLRYDRFSTGAERVVGVPRISSNPAFDPNDVSALMTPDEAHTAWSPRAQVGYRLNAKTDLRLGIGRQVQMPDFGLSLAGITTDVSVTGPFQVYGTDMGYASTVLAELGATRRFSSSTSLDAVVYGKQLTGQAVLGSIQALDPLTLTQRTVYQVQDTGEGDVFGAEFRLSQRIGPYFQGFAGYAYQHATLADGGVAPDWSRPHTFAGAIGGTLPDGWKSGSTIGSILQNGGAWATFRFASGTPYTACAPTPGNEGVLSGEACLGGVAGEINGVELPMTKQFDLKLARGFYVGSTRITGYLDARNLFNFGNTNAVYAATGTTASPAFEGQQWVGDSFAYANEAVANSVYLGDGSLNLQFGGAGAGGCGNWITQDGRPNAPNCVYLVRAEQRFGDGDGVFDLAEQQRASAAFYNALNGSQLLTGPWRFIRLGVTVQF